MGKENSYYDAGGLSAIDVMRAKLTAEQYEGFLLGSVYKYALRFNFKGQEDSDLDKLIEYACWLQEYRSLWKKVEVK